MHSNVSAVPGNISGSNFLKEAVQSRFFISGTWKSDTVKLGRYGRCSKPIYISWPKI
jgi:hypothetical protein